MHHSASHPSPLRPRDGQRRARRVLSPDAAGREDGAAMLMVLMVLLMTTATATFAIHSTSMEMRSAGYLRQSMQTAYVAEGGLYAGIAHIDNGRGAEMWQTYQQTSVAGNTVYGPNAVVGGIRRGFYRVTSDAIATRAAAPPLESDPARVPSLGPHMAYTPSFSFEGTDILGANEEVSGHDLSRPSALGYLRGVFTSRAVMAAPSDIRATGDARDFHETAVSARVVAIVGPLNTGGG